MERIKRLITAFLMLMGSVLFADNSFFDNYVYQSWTTFDTLNGTTTTDVIQTKDGYINIGTYEGLARFDGVNFTTHKKTADNGLTFVSVRAILEDSNGTLWIGSNDEGLQRIDDEGKKTYTIQNGLPNNSIRALAEDKKGNVWVGTAAGVVYIDPKGHMIAPQFDSGTVSKGVIVTEIFCDSAGRVWLLTENEKGFFLFDDGIFRTKPELDVYDNYFATSICQDLKGAFWVGLGEKGIFHFTNGKIENVKTHTILDTYSTNSSYAAADGKIWFGTEKGIVVYDNGNFYEYNSTSSLANAKINKIISDREGNIWIATDRSGIGKLTQGKFKMKRLNCSVNGITEDRTGNVWVATDTGVVSFRNDSRFENTLTEFTKEIRVRDISVGRSGNIYVSCYTSPGFVRYTPDEKLRAWTKESGLAGNKVRVSVEGKDGRVYVGTTTGLSIIRPDGRIKNFKQVNGLENEYVMALYEDAKGVVWVGTDGGGIYLIKDEQIISHFSSEDGLAGNVIFKITQDASGYWICSGSGITRCPDFDSTSGIPKKFQNINSENGIGTDSVFQILTDSTRRLWFTSNHGIASTSYNDISDVAKGKIPKVNVKYYNKNDGLDSDGPTATAMSTVDRYGRIWFTMVDGIAIYDPVKVKENRVMPLVKIETVGVDNKIILDNTLISVKPETILLQPGTKRVDITYSGISFDAPERIKFTHKLTNFENVFNAPTSARIMSYTNLKPGKHTFLVNAINGDGFYSNQAEAVLFVQKPYLYQIPAFWIILLILFLCTIGLIFFLKQQRILRENARLESMVRTRTAELNLEKEKTDELLHAILPAEIARELKDGIHSIGNNFDDVTILFSDIVDFTKTSSGYTAAEIVDALNDLFTLFDQRAQKEGVEKIKTIGDAYMASCGLPTPNHNHAKVMIKFAKGMLDDLAEYNKTAKIKFNIRIGLNSGPATAGVIGKTKFIYDVWGNTVNVASRMESAANAGGIKVSQATYDHLKNSNIKFSRPIKCDVKGKGVMTTYDVVLASPKKPAAKTVKAASGTSKKSAAKTKAKTASKKTGAAKSAKSAKPSKTKTVAKRTAAKKKTKTVKK